MIQPHLTKVLLLFSSWAITAWTINQDDLTSSNFTGLPSWNMDNFTYLFHTTVIKPVYNSTAVVFSWGIYSITYVSFLTKWDSCWHSIITESEKLTTVVPEEVILDLWCVLDKWLWILSQTDRHQMRNYQGRTPREEWEWIIMTFSI